MFTHKTACNCCGTANTDAWPSLDSMGWIENARFITSANEERFVFASGGASYLPPCSRSYQMKPVEGRSPWLPQPSSRTALGLKLHFHKYIKRCFSAFIKFNHYYRLLSIPQNVSLSTSCQECFCLSHQDHTDTSAQLQSKRMQLLD